MVKKTNNIRNNRKDIQKLFKTIQWAISGPVIVMPAYTNTPIPKDIKDSITTQRMILVMKHQSKASEAEAMWYISTVSLSMQLTNDWSQIYMYLTRKHTLSINKELPAFLEKEIVLCKTQQTELKSLREWLYEKSMKHIK